MNRLILIGNGFDLAHGLKTSYGNFIEHLWLKIYRELHQQVKYDLRLRGSREGSFECEDSNKLIKIRYSHVSAYGNGLNDDICITSKTCDLILKTLDDNSLTNDIREFIGGISNTDCSYHNSFFDIITKNYLNKDWSDIEADYYRELKTNKDSEEKVNILNSGFKQIKELLREYLSSLDNPKKISKIENIIYDSIDIDDIKISFKETLSNELCSKISKLHNAVYENIKQEILNLSRLFSQVELNNIENIVYSILNNQNVRDKFKELFLPDNILLLNFNYTSSDSGYMYKTAYGLSLSNIEMSSIHIHGSLDDQTKHMIFGYGDEEDDNYKELEKSETKGLLDNVKSINYLEASNYRNMEKFIEAGPYQILIMGMSCGMADRTMLRKLFQHKNCISIKPYFYEWQDEFGNKYDNYTKLVQSIFRCFSDKDLLRSIVTDKSKCKPLPQQPKKT